MCFQKRAWKLQLLTIKQESYLTDVIHKSLSRTPEAFSILLQYRQ